MELKIIAEVAQGYEGNEKLSELFVKAAAGAKADAVKFQIFYAEELALPDYKYYDLFKTLELPFSFWKKMAALAHELGIEFYSDVFGSESLRQLREIGADGFKIHATDINNIPLLKLAAQSGVKIFLAVGGCLEEEIQRAMDVLYAADLTLLYGFQAEPTPVDKNNLNKIRLLQERWKKPVGFMDHTEGGTPLSFDLPTVALGLGACVIEKHLTLSREAQLEDYISALTAEEFAAWVKKIREAATALGRASWTLSKEEEEYRKKVRRAVCAARDLRPGEVLSLDDCCLKRTGSAEAIFNMEEVVGKKLKSPVSKNGIIPKENLR